MLKWLFLWWLCGLAAGTVALFKQRSGCGYFLLGMVAGPFALIVAILPPYRVRPVNQDDPERGERGAGVRRP